MSTAQEVRGGGLARKEVRPRLLRLRSGRRRGPRLNPDAGNRLDIALAIAVRDGRILVAQRGHDQHLPGAWEFPGGKIGEGEEPAEAALRELREESGLTATAADPLLVFVHDYPDRRLRFHAFVVSGAQGEVAIDGDRAFSWVEPGSLEALAMPEANRAILRALRWRLG